LPGFFLEVRSERGEVRGEKREGAKKNYALYDLPLSLLTESGFACHLSGEYGGLLFVNACVSTPDNE